MDRTPIAPHVLIIGGGVQGLWLLDELRTSGREAVLLERRRLGGEQTCHSHVYIHRGHMYNEREQALAGRLGIVNALWGAWRDRHPGAPLEAPASCFGFQNRADAEDKAALWDDLELEYELLDEPPEAIAGGVIRSVLRSPEYCLDGEWLVSELAERHHRYICRIDSVDEIRFTDQGDRIKRLDVTLPRGQRMVFHPGALVLAAGAGNQALLDLAGGGVRDRVAKVRDRQQIRKAHMLVVAGPDDVLSRLDAGLVLPKLRGLFIVPRRDAATGENVWLVSDNRSPDVLLSDDWLAHDEQWWLPEVLAALRELSGRTFADPARLRWGIYAGPKAEGRASGGMPHEERVETFRGIGNLWAVWPTKLTLAPVAARRVLDDLQERRILDDFGPRMATTWDALRVPVPVAPERWRLTPLMPWEEFRRCYAGQTDQLDFV